MNEHHKQSGGLLLISAAVLVMVIGVAALVLDISKLYLVRGELQNAADAAAMAGVPCLYRRTECANLAASVPDWSTSSARASNFVSNNKVQGLALSQATVNTGYWNMMGSPAGLQSSSITPGAYDYPAVQVTVRQAPGINGGPVLLSLASVLGITQGNVSATSTAVISHPAMLNPFPLVLGKCLYDTYWDYTTSSPKIATQTNPPGFDLPQIIGQPYFFKATSSYKVGACEAGQWTSLMADSNSSSFISNLINSGSPQSIAIGDLIWIQPGSQTSIYSDIHNCSAAGNKLCEYVMVPVVEFIGTHSHQPVYAFACVRVLDGVGGSSKYVLFQMSADPVKCTNNGSGVGPNYGVNTPPRLVQ